MAIWAWIVAGIWAMMLSFEAYQLWLLCTVTNKISLLPQPDSFQDQVDSPAVKIVIPARNEQRDIAKCLDAVLAQDYQNLSVRVVDDRSDDRTAEIVREYARRDPRVELHQVQHLPEGWTGKTHALWHGTQNLEEQWLLFIDADVTLDPWAVSSVLHEAVEKDVKLLTLWPRMAREGFWQQAVMPLCGAYLGMWFAPTRVNDPNSSVGFVNGQFVLIRRDAYEQVDGFRSVRQCIVEDIALGFRAKKLGVPCRVVLGSQIASVRMYTNVRAMFDGWTRIFTGGLRGRLPIAATALVVLITAWPLIAAVLLAYALLSSQVSFANPPVASALLSGPEFFVFCALGAVHFCVFNLANFHLWRAAGLSTRWLLCYPLGIAVCFYMLVRTLWILSSGRAMNWRGMQYRVDEKGAVVN